MASIRKQASQLSVDPRSACKGITILGIALISDGMFLAGWREFEFCFWARFFIVMVTNGCGNHRTVGLT